MSNKILGTLTLVVTLMAPAVWLEARQSGTSRAELRAAIDTESVEGNLAGAIKQYQAIVQKYGKTDRPTAAAALLRMADCYRKLGDAQARATYERVVREFGDIDTAAGSARAQLAALNVAAGPAASPALTLRRVYEGPGLDWCNGLSSDVRSLSHPDWETGNIAVADLRTGDTRAVTTGGSISRVTAQSGEFGECTIFSPDDKQIAFYWDTNTSSELRIAGVDGSKLRTLYRGGREKPYMRPLDWSRDGRFLLAEIAPKKATHIAAISTADGSARIIKELGQGAGNVDAQFSPDGQQIAYAFRESPDSTKRDVFLIAGNGTGDIRIVNHPADDRLLGWAPDGKTLFFASDRTGSNGVWSLAIENGKPRGAPMLVKADLGPVTPVRFLNGTLYYHLNSQMSDVYIASMDPASGKPLGPAVAAKANFSGSIAKPDWSPDGRALAYLAFRGTSGFPAAPEHIAILNLETGVERRVRPGVELLDPYGVGPIWSPDGRSLLVIARQQTPEHGLYRVDVESGDTTLVKSARGQFLLHAAWSRDGQAVFYTIGGGCAAQEPCPGHRIMRRDLNTGTDVEMVALEDSPGFPKLAASHDGRWLAFSSRPPDSTLPGSTLSIAVSVMPAAGGSIREVYRIPETAAPGFVTWGPDGRHLYFTRRGEVWRITAEGAGLEKIDFGATPVRGWFSFSPDGRRIAFTMGESKSELWALENLASAVKRP